MKKASFNLALLLTLGMLAGCQSAPTYYVSSNALLAEAVDRPPFLTGIHTEAGEFQARLPDEQPFQISAEMRDFAHHFAPRTLAPEYRLRQLIWAMMSPSGLGLQYNPNATYSSRVSFERREANCLSFTILFIALAEEIGLQAEFNEVDVPPVWDIQDDNRLIYYKHVNAMVDLPWVKDKVVDINMDNYNENYKQRRLTKSDAEALYYNNRGVEAMAAGNYEASYYLFRKAIDVQPDMGFIWGNFGTLYKNVGYQAHAEALYSFALSSYEFDVVVAGNLSRLYRADGRIVEAEDLEARIESKRSRNPYFQYAYALAAFDNHRTEQALTLVNRAINLYRKDHRFYHLRARIHARMGMMANADRDLRQALTVAEELNVKDRYQSKLDSLVALH